MVLFLFCLGWQRTPNLDVRRSAAPRPRCLIDRDTGERAGLTEVSVRDLRNHGGDVLDSVMRGESVTVTREGKPVAELRPIAEGGTAATVLVERWRTVAACWTPASSSASAGSPTRRGSPLGASCRPSLWPSCQSGRWWPEPMWSEWRARACFNRWRPTSTRSPSTTEPPEPLVVSPPNFGLRAARAAHGRMTRSSRQPRWPTTSRCSPATLTTSLGSTP